MKIRFIAALVMAPVIAPVMAMEQQQHSSEQAHTKAVLEIFKRMPAVVENAELIPVFKNLQLTAKIGTNNEFVVPYITTALAKKNNQLKGLSDQIYKVSKAIRKEEKDRKYEKYYGRQQEALYLDPDDYYTWRDYTPGNIIKSNEPSDNERQEKKLIAQREQLTKEIRFLTLKKGLATDKHIS